jgi:tetratricopeptide (TPR) repeat protein
MAQLRAKMFLLAFAACCSSLSYSQQENLPQPPELPTLSPPIPPRWVVFPEPPPIPSSADDPVPDLGSVPGPPDRSRSILKRAIDRAKPDCLDAAIHTCWSSPPGDATTGMSKEDREFVQDMEIGTYYFRKKNYRGAMFRFRHALDSKPGEPEAKFKLAESLDKLGKNAEAVEAYETYLEIQPSGGHAAEARGALEQLRSPRPK